MIRIVYSDKVREHIIRLYESGYSILFIAKDVGNSINTILGALREWGVYRAQNKILDESKIQLGQEIEDRILDLFSKRVSIHNMEKILGVRSKAISIILGRKGLKRRPLKETQRLYSRRYLDKLRAMGKKPNRYKYANKKDTRRGRKKNPEEARKYYQKNKVRIVKRQRIRRQLDSRLRILDNLRNRIYLLLKKGSKSAHTLELLGCSRDELISHLENQFTTVITRGGKSFTMSWENYGLRGWHIDHIRPCCSFDITEPEQQRECFHYTNLRPLYSYDNLSRKYNPYFQKTK